MNSTSAVPPGVKPIGHTRVSAGSSARFVENRGVLQYHIEDGCAVEAERCHRVRTTAPREHVASYWPLSYVQRRRELGRLDLYVEARRHPQLARSTSDVVRINFEGRVRDHSGKSSFATCADRHVLAWVLSARPTGYLAASPSIATCTMPSRSSASSKASRTFASLPSGFFWARSLLPTLMVMPW